MASLFGTRQPDEDVAHATAVLRRIRKGQDTLTASARRITSHKIERIKVNSDSTEAWDMRGLVGEMRFVTNSIAVKGSKAKLFVARVPSNQEDDPVPVKRGDALDAWREFTKYTDVRELIKRCLANLQVTGEGYLAGVPGTLLGHDWEEMEWFFLSKNEVKAGAGEDDVTLKILGSKINTTKSQVTLVEVWNPHPNDSSMPDSPVLSAMPILREIVGLTMHVSAQIDSRLAGAGILAIPQSATLAVETEDDESQIDPFTAALMLAMETAISDRSSAAALMPITITIPDDAVGKFEHIKFWTDLDSEAKSLREEAIRRFATAMDAPAELLLGQADMNHWGAWVSREETIQNNVEPLLDILVRAISQEILWPVLVDSYDLDEDVARTFCIHYSTTHLISRSNRTQDALNLHARGVISDEALRNVADFDEKDAPAVLITDPAMKVVMDLVKASPSLAVNPGIPSLVEQIQAMMDAGGSSSDTGNALKPPEENANPTGPSETPAQGLPPGEGGTRGSESQ